MEAQDFSVKFDDLLAQCGQCTEDVNDLGKETLITSRQLIRQLNQDGCCMVQSLEESAAVRRERNLVLRASVQGKCEELSAHIDGTVKLKEKELEILWEKAFSIRVAQELHSQINEIKELSGSILTSQEDLIKQLRNELEQFETLLQVEIERQAEDIKEMRHRMKFHLNTMRETYGKELRVIGESLEQEYRSLLEKHTDQFHDILQQWSVYEMNALEQFGANCDIWDIDFKETEERYYSEAKQCREKLTSDIELVERELEKLKFTYLASNEALEYNCQILKLREEENSTIKARQKRKMNKLHDHYRSLKLECQTSQKKQQEGKEKLLREIEQLTKDNLQLEQKFYTIKTADANKLESVCKLAENEIQMLLQKVSNIDKQIHEDILRMPWKPLVPVNEQKIVSNEEDILNAEILENDVLETVYNSIRFLITKEDALLNYPLAEEKKEHVKTVLGITNVVEFKDFLRKMKKSQPQFLLRDITEYIRMRLELTDLKEVTTSLTFASSQSIIERFNTYKIMIPKSRIDIWNMLVVALTRYERILKDRITLATEIQKLWIET